jgi:hypothetical protein
MSGLFGIFMPLIHGEGVRAFYRLQLELLKISGDDSLLAWSLSDGPAVTELLVTTGPFAATPVYFDLLEILREIVSMRSEGN